MTPEPHAPDEFLRRLDAQFARDHIDRALNSQTPPLVEDPEQLARELQAANPLADLAGRPWTATWLGRAARSAAALSAVLVVAGTTVGLLGPRMFGRVGQSNTAAARAQIELLGAALDHYRLDIGAYPSASEGLEALVRNPNKLKWNGPYLKKGLPKDPWGNAYKYRCCPGQHGEYDLWSEGADGAPGGEGDNADVTSWK